MLSARETALRALISFRREGAWPDLYLKKACAGMRAEEAALASTITYGVLQNREYLDFLLSRFSARPLEKITPQVLDALRLVPISWCSSPGSPTAPPSTSRWNW